MGKLFYNSRVFRQDDFYYADDDPHHIRSIESSGADPDPIGMILGLLDPDQDA
jgi:hypothetical protein